MAWQMLSASCGAANAFFCRGMVRYAQASALNHGSVRHFWALPARNATRQSLSSTTLHFQPFEPH